MNATNNCENLWVCSATDSRKNLEQRFIFQHGGQFILSTPLINGDVGV